MTSAGRNPAWDRDELILALDVYLRVPRARNDKKDPALQDLSETLRSLPIHTDRPDPTRFRNLNSVYLKLQNFKAIDPEYTARGLSGLTAGGTRREQAVWDRYAQEPEELRRVAEAIRQPTWTFARTRFFRSSPTRRKKPTPKKVVF